MADADEAETFDSLVERIRAHRILTRGKRVPVTVWLTNEAGSDRARAVTSDFGMTVHLLHEEPGPVHTVKKSAGKTPMIAARAMLVLLDRELADKVRKLRQELVDSRNELRAQIEALTGTPEAL